MQKFKIILISIGILLLAVSIGGIIFGFQLKIFSTTPANPLQPYIEIHIKPGQGLKTVSNTLKHEKIITSSLLFRLLARISQVDKKIQAGEFLLTGAMSPKELLEIMTSGKVKLYKLTVPEGYNIKEIAAVVEKKGFCDQNSFVALAYDKKIINDLKINAVSLEGYLFPETYFFPKNTPCKEIINEMVLRFKTVFTKEWEQRAKDLKYSIHDIVILASIIEKETGDASERPLISSVFHNRLNKGIRLESDPTVIYGIQDYNGNIKRKHLKEKTPYNTYQINGLPFGPITNPGAMSLKAALFPSDSEYLFFVSKKNTTHKFSKTIQEHNRAVKKYQLKR